MKYIKAISVLIFIYILSLLDYNVVYKSIKNLDLFYLLIYGILFYLFFILKTYRWHIIQNYFSRPITFKDNFLISIETLYLSYITPSKIGDMAKLWMIKKYFHIDKKETLVVYIFDRIQDIFFLVICALFGIMFIINIDFPMYIYFILLLIVTIYLFKNSIINSFQNKLKFNYYIKTDLNFEIKLFFLNSMIFVIYFLQLYFLAKAMNLEIEYSFIVSLASISALATLIPISISGLGVREGIFIYLLAIIEVSKEDAVILSLLDNIVLAAILLILLHMFSKVFIKNTLGEK